MKSVLLILFQNLMIGKSIIYKVNSHIAKQILKDKNEIQEVQNSILNELIGGFKNENIKSVLVYSSSPVQKVIGEFQIEQIINEHDNK